LKIERVGIEDNFFELGGHSLMATQVVSRMRAAFGTDVPLRALFEAPTVEMLARRIGDGQGDTAVAIVPVARDGKLPLSFAQQRQWFLDQFQPGNALYNIPAAVRLRGRLDADALKRALDEIMRRHEVLSTTFATVDGEPALVFGAARALALPVTDLSDLAPAGREEAARSLVGELVRAPFDLATAPLLRAALIRLDAEEHVFVLTMHHIVSDGWSMGLLVQEVTALYTAFVQGSASPLPELAIQYADYASWQHNWLSGAVLERQTGYWSERLAGAPALLTLPTDRPRPPQQSYRGATIPFVVSAQLSGALQALCKQTHCTMFMALNAAFAVLLSRHANQDDVSIGTFIANRTQSAVEPLIGFFVNTLVLRTQVDGNDTVAALLKQVRGNALGAYANQDLPFEHVVEVLKPERHAGHAPLFQAALVLQNTPTGRVELPGLTMEPLAADTASAKFDITLTLTQGGDQLFGAFEYSTDLFDAATIERMSGHFTRILGAMAADPAARVMDIDMLGAHERRNVLEQWNATGEAYPRELTLARMFEAQVEAAPHATALVFEDQQLTYAELNARANRLAHHLRSVGVGPDVLVAICVERSPDMVVGLLAILKAGGAYVPLDPSNPADRLAYMLADAAPALLLTQQHLAPRWADSGTAVFCLDADWSELAVHGEGNPVALSTPEHLAYLIYTSGSTGQPKGVMVGQRSVVNLLATMSGKVGAGSGDAVLALTTLSFDIAGLELYLPLMTGGRIVLAGGGVGSDPALLARLLQEQRVSIMQATPSTWTMLLDSGWEPQAELRALCGGEALPPALAANLGARVSALWNVYGPTETTIWSTARHIQAGEVSIGTPIGNTQVYILDSYLQPVPQGVAGQLYIAGDGVARGYLKRPDLTAERFVPDPFGAVPGARMYMTGDLARYLADGSIEYLGRIDSQVKIRGFRIELGEIEAALAAVDGVREALVLAREDVAGDKRLVAYIVGQADTPALRSALLQSLPDYMVPSQFVQMDAFPLNANGKVDRKALPAPDLTANAAVYLAPRTAQEATLAAIWAEVLKIERVGIEDNFFELGGHSLMATQVVSRMRAAFGTDVPLRALFEAPTV
ncbi:MAG: amino acid adenylation domain-containing protein, partial [Bacteriovorax sp.]|nr:amino acid adenylation domain-containing protein [Rhizobacter sp.]